MTVHVEQGTARVGALGRPRRGPGRRIMDALQHLGVRFGLVGVLVVLWQVWATSRGSFTFPPPAQIAARIHELWFSAGLARGFVTPEFWADVVPSVVRALGGWAIAAVVGVVLGLFAGRSVRLRGYLDPPVNFLRSLPQAALVPTFLIVFGANDVTRIAVIAFGCVWFVLLNTMQATRSLDPIMRETALAFHVPSARQFFFIALPAVAPKVFAALRVTLSLSLVIMVVSEWILTDSGLGFLLVDSQRMYRIVDMWAALVLLAAIGYLLNVLLRSVEAKILGWHEGVTGRSESA